MAEEDINMPKWQFFLPEMRGYNDIFFLVNLIGTAFDIMVANSKYKLNKI